MKVVDEVNKKTKAVQFIRKGILRGNNIEFYYEKVKQTDTDTSLLCTGTIIQEVGYCQLEESDLRRFKTGDKFNLFFIYPDVMSNSPTRNIGKLIAIVPTCEVKNKRGMSKNK